MKLSSVFSEAWRNIETNTSRFFLIGVSLSIAVNALTIADLTASKQVLHSASEYRAARANVLKLHAPGSINGTRCDSFTVLPGVRAAGAIRTSDYQFRPAALPSSPYSSFEASPGFSKVLGATDLATGLYLSSDAAEAVGTLPGGAVFLTTGTAEVAGTFDWPSDGRQGGLGYSAIAPVPNTAPYDECWVDSWPQSDELRDVLLTSLSYESDANDVNPQVEQVNGTLGTNIDWSTRYLERLPLSAPWAAAVVGLFVGGISVRVRRLQLASDLHAGLKRRDLVAVISVELLAPIFLVWSTIAAATAITLTDVALVDRGPLQIQSFSIAVMGTVGFAMGTLSGLLRTREKHLFKYFKAR